MTDCGFAAVDLSKVSRYHELKAICSGWMITVQAAVYCRMITPPLSVTSVDIVSYQVH